MHTHLRSRAGTTPKKCRRVRRNEHAKTGNMASFSPRKRVVATGDSDIGHGSRHTRESGANRLTERRPRARAARGKATFSQDRGASPRSRSRGFNMLNPIEPLPCSLGCDIKSSHSLSAAPGVRTGSEFATFLGSYDIGRGNSSRSGVQHDRAGRRRRMRTSAGKG